MIASAQCECGSMEVKVSASPVVQLTCHCRDCQAFSGLEYIEAAFFKKEDCEISTDTMPETLQGGTGADKLHYACPQCATPLFVEVKALKGAIAIIASRLKPFNFESEAHIWTSHKVCGVINDTDIPCSEGPPPKEIVDHMISTFFK